MSVDGSADERLRTAALVWIDAITYALVVTLVTTGCAVAVGLATGGGLVRAKVALFFGGCLLMAYATARLWPSSPSDLEDRTGTGESMPAVHDRTRFQAIVQSIPPVRWLEPPPPERRMTTPGKLFVGSVLVLAVSYLMEAVFGIA